MDEQTNQRHSGSLCLLKLVKEKKFTPKIYHLVDKTECQALAELLLWLSLQKATRKQEDSLNPLEEELFNKQCQHIRFPPHRVCVSPSVVSDSLRSHGP